MADVEDELADIDLRVELFANLADQRRVMRFPVIDLPAGEFPQPLEVDALLAARHEIRAILLDYCGDDGDHDLERRGNDVQDRLIGHASHFGLRAVQMVAPKSISA